MQFDGNTKIQKHVTQSIVAFNRLGITTLFVVQESGIRCRERRRLLSQLLTEKIVLVPNRINFKSTGNYFPNDFFV